MTTKTLGNSEKKQLPENKSPWSAFPFCMFNISLSDLSFTSTYRPLTSYSKQWTRSYAAPWGDFAQASGAEQGVDVSEKDRLVVNCWPIQLVLVNIKQIPKNTVGWFGLFSVDIPIMYSYVILTSINGVFDTSQWWYRNSSMNSSKLPVVTQR